MTSHNFQCFLSQKHSQNLPNFTQLYKTLQTTLQQLCNTLHNFTTTLQTHTQLLQNSFKFVQNLQKTLHQIQHYTQLCNNSQHFAPLYSTLQHFTQLYTTLHKLCCLHELANFIVMETTLFHIQRSHSGCGTGAVQAWMQSLARGVWACREAQVTHRDSKAVNCILCLGQEAFLDFKFVDFGNAAMASAGGGLAPPHVVHHTQPVAGLVPSTAIPSLMAMAPCD